MLWDKKKYNTSHEIYCILIYYNIIIIMKDLCMSVLEFKNVSYTNWLVTFVVYLYSVIK